MLTAAMKVVLVGDTRVGKTCLLTRLTQGVFRDSAATVGAAFQTHTVTTQFGARTLQIWDTAGQEKYRSLAPMYYRSAHVAILCFDLTNRESFQALGAWADELAEKGTGELQTIIVGCKADLTDARAVAREEAQEFAFEKGASHYLECSAKAGSGVADLFTKAAELLGQGSSIGAPETAQIAPAPAAGGGECAC
jgi:small GTP-binding protein